MLLGRALTVFHFSRMTDREVATVREGGFRLTSLELLRERIDAQVDEGNLMRSDAEMLFAASPLHLEAFGRRLGLFWTVAPPPHVDSGAVTLLLGHWGGDAAYWCADERMSETLRGVGRGRVFTVSVPISNAAADHSWKVANALVSRRAREIGIEVAVPTYDFALTHAVPATDVLSVTTEGEGGYGNVSVLPFA